MFNRLASAVSGLRLHDVNCGLKAYRAEVLHDMRLYGELHRFIPVLAAYRGYRIAEIPVNHRAREHGRSRYGPERYLRGFFDLLSVTFMGRYRYRPLHLFGGVGLSTVRMNDTKPPGDAVEVQISKYGWAGACGGICAAAADAAAKNMRKTPSTRRICLCIRHAPPARTKP